MYWRSTEQECAALFLHCKRPLSTECAIDTCWSRCQRNTFFPCVQKRTRRLPSWSNASFNRRTSAPLERMYSIFSQYLLHTALSARTVLFIYFYGVPCRIWFCQRFLNQPSFFHRTYINAMTERRRCLPSIITLMEQHWQMTKTTLFQIQPWTKRDRSECFAVRAAFFINKEGKVVLYWYVRTASRHLIAQVTSSCWTDRCRCDILLTQA